MHAQALIGCDLNGESTVVAIVLIVIGHSKVPLSRVDCEPCDFMGVVRIVKILGISQRGAIESGTDVLRRIVSVHAHVATFATRLAVVGKRKLRAIRERYIENTVRQNLYASNDFAHKLGDEFLIHDILGEKIPAHPKMAGLKGK
jgi:hypothetical protein